MVGQLDQCPKHWRHRCYPRDCDPPTKPQTTQPLSQPTHNILYLVDEHDISTNTSPKRTDTPLRRYVWHYGVANLDTFNIGEKPDTINLHEFIANPRVNKEFRWEGYMFDVPGGRATCRVGIVHGADRATDVSLSGPVVPNQPPVDRVVGFAGTYVDNSVPLGPVVQVRRDDSYRPLHKFSSGGQKVAWHCAYYVTKETPKKTSSGFSGVLNAAQEEGSPDQPPPTEQDLATIAYNALMDENVEDDAKVSEGSDSWGGQMFGFTIAEEAPVGKDDDSALDPIKGDALVALQND